MLSRLRLHVTSQLRSLCSSPPETEPEGLMSVTFWPATRLF